MDIKNRLAYLTPEEQQISGLVSPIPAGSIDMDQLRTKADARVERVEYLMAADDDELTRADRASLPRELERAQWEKIVLNNMADALTLHGIIRTLNS